MAHHQITLNDEDLQALFLNGDGMKRLVERVVNLLLKSQFEEQIAARRYERTETRQAYRNGVRRRKMQTRVGTLTLEIAQTRNGSFSTELFTRYQRSEQAFVLALMEMVINGVSTRKVAAITRELCGAEFSKSTVSRLCQQLDPVVTAWNERPLGNEQYPFLLVDAIVIRCRENGRIRSVSALLATGIRSSGEREVLGMQLGDSESEETWTRLFQWLKGRGLHGVDLVTSDDHGGLVRAIRTQFQGASWQRCQAHFARNVMDAAPKAHRDELKGRLRSVFDAPNLETARTLRDRITEDFASRAPRAVETLERGFDDATAILALPESVRLRTRTTNMVERLNEEIRRRERVIRIFPNRESASRLLGALLIELDEKWRTERRLYLNMAQYWEWRKTAKLKSGRPGAVTRIS